MKKLVLCMAVLSLLSLGGSAFAVKDASDNVPAATLLLPYFEVDLSTLDGITTLFSINNASAVEQIAHVTVWSNSSVVVFDFDVFLTGYDVVTFNMRDILNLNITEAARSWNDEMLHGYREATGDWSYGAPPFDGNPTNYYDLGAYNCEVVFPTYPTYAADHPAFKGHVQAALTGKQSPVTGLYYGCPIGGDNIARGYITVDVVGQCNLYSPKDSQYYAYIRDQNVLWGDYFYINPGQNFAQGETLVHIESFYPQYTGTDRTFYGRYFGTSDGREPLPTSFATRFLDGGPFTGGTDLIVWREGDPTISVANPPDYGPVCNRYGTYDYAFFDEQENPWQKFCISGDPSCRYRTLESHRIDPATIFFPMPYDFGWLYWNLQWTSRAQAWVTTVMDANGKFSVGFDAIGLDNANFPIRTMIADPKW